MINFGMDNSGNSPMLRCEQTVERDVLDVLAYFVHFEGWHFNVMPTVLGKKTWLTSLRFVLMEISCF